MDINSKLPHVGTTIFTEMSSLSKQYDAINLSQGFPNFNIDSSLIKLVEKAIQEGNNQYAPMRGAIELREAVAEKILDAYQTSYNPEKEIIITAGATQAIFCAISAFINPADEVIVFKPAYDCYEPTIELNKGKIVPIQLKHPNYKVNWKEVESKVNSNTRMIIVNTPQNPCGTIFSKEDMLELERITSNTNIIVLSDEVYEHMVFDNELHESVSKFSGLKERSLITVSFGKTYHATGWKLGYCYGPEELINEFVKVHQFNVFCVTHPMQLAIANYMANKAHYQNLPNFYQQKRDFFLEAISSSRFKFTPTKATYFQLLDYSNISSENDVEFAKRLTREFKIASIPMSVFNQDQLDFKVLRFCFAKTEETLLKAAEILNKI